MDMQEIVIKSEGSEEILLFYVDENGTEQSVVTSVGNVVEQHQVEEIVEQNFETSVVTETVDTTDMIAEEDGMGTLQRESLYNKDRWSESETKRLLQFYTDNKETFINGTTKKKHLWTIACKTMLFGKNPTACEIKLRNIKKKYIQIRVDQKKGIYKQHWTHLDLCHQAFQDDPNVTSILNSLNIGPDCNEVQTVITQYQQQQQQMRDDGIVIIKKTESSRPMPDEKVKKMLQLYIQQKNRMKNIPKEVWQKKMWEEITMELGDADPEYWYKRFLNFKQHYIRLVDKRESNGPECIQWPYMSYFDEIYEDDEVFQKKYAKKNTTSINVVPKEEQVLSTAQEPDWDVTELTVLVKYHFDCLHEFQDPTIPNVFLWNEVGRLLDRNPDACQFKYNQLKMEHLDNTDVYDVKSRIPLAIVLDNIISKETELLFETQGKTVQAELWKTTELDELVQFLYNNMEMLNDPVCYNVCWAKLSMKLNRSAYSCKKQWDDLKELYKSILNDKKENPDMEIDWRYIELFDRIFDYGMNQQLLDGFDKLSSNQTKLNVKKVTINLDSDKDSEYELNGMDDDDDNTEDGRSRGEAKAFKILEFYQKHKEKFSRTNRKKSAIWEAIAKQVGMTPTQCAHRFRNLKQVYMAYLHRECKTPEKPITWPYYTLCKKVFGYRALKSKIIKKETTDADYNYREWSPKEIKTLITFYSQNYDFVNKNLNNDECWTPLAEDIGKSETVCREKFLELRKSYRKLKTMLTRNPQTKVSWKYFNMFDGIFTQRANEGEPMQVDAVEEEYELMTVNDLKKEIQDDDDVQCIIVIPEGQDIAEAMMNAQHVTLSSSEVAVTKQDNNSIDTAQFSNKWTKKTKKRLLILYLKYLKLHRFEKINALEMWKEIAEKLPNKTPLSCRKIFARLKKNRLAIDNIEDVKKKTPYYAVLEKILQMKPKFCKKLVQSDGYLMKAAGASDVPLPKQKVIEILEYYLEHLDEFLSPRYEKRKVWIELANKVDLPMIKVHNKVKFLKNIYSKRDENVNEEIPFVDILEKIFKKEEELNSKIDAEKELITKELVSSEENEIAWSDDEIEKLLWWYLVNLDKFKNPKYVRSYLWREAADILMKSPVVCSKKMAEIRTEYRTKVRETPNELHCWKFFDFCQKIYGTGKKNDI